MALIRRVTTGQSVFSPDRGHLHHALLLRGWSVGKTVAFMTGLTIVTCGGALASYYTDHEAYALVATASLFMTLAATRVFGHTELKLVASHTRAFARTALQRVRRIDTESEKSIHLQGTRKWDTIWQALLEAVPVYNLAGVKLRINIPLLHESFFADWNYRDRTSTSSSNIEPWQFSLPLEFNGNSIGKLTLQGTTTGSQAMTEMQQVLDFLEPLEAEIEQIIAEVVSFDGQSRLGQELQVKTQEEMNHQQPRDAPVGDLSQV